MDIKKARKLMEISLESGGIIPVTKAASNLGETIQSAKSQPVVVTQNGYGIGVIMSTELFGQLRELAREGLEHLEMQQKIQG